MSGQITVTHEDAIAIVTFDFPERRNALSADLQAALHDVLAELQNSRACRAIVLTGAGGHFCAGADVSMMVTDRTVVEWRLRIERAQRIIWILAGGPKPVVAAIEGNAFGLGLSLALACDVLVAAEDAKLCTAFSRIGLMPDTGLMWTLPQRVGTARARQLCITSRVVDAAEAQAMGMIDEQAPPGGALAAALVHAAQLAAAAPLSVALTKAVFARSANSLEDVLRAELDHMPTLFHSEDHKAAAAAFREKRSVTFTGR